MGNRTRKERAESKRARMVTDTDGVKPVSTDTTSAPLPDVRGLLEVPEAYKSDLELLRRYLGCAEFSEHETSGMLRRIARIIATSPDEKTQISAFAVLLKQAKLSFDIAQARRPQGPAEQHIHGHVHLPPERNRVAELAARCGMHIAVSADENGPVILSDEGTIQE